MTDGTLDPKRRATPISEERQRALQLAKPYLHRFEGWQKQAAFINAALLARALSPAEKQEQLDRLAELVAEVRTTRTQFEQEALSVPDHGRISDVRAAFERLLSILGTGQG